MSQDKRFIIIQKYFEGRKWKMFTREVMKVLK